MTMVSLLAAVFLHAAIVTGGWMLGGTTGVIAAVAIVLAVEHRLARARATKPRRHPKDHRARH